MTTTNKTAFWANTIRVGECIEWNGRIDRAGYGRFYHDGKEQGAHRVALLLSGNAVSPGDVVRHSCDNPRCVNPEHLSVGSQIDNVQDRVSRNRSAVGEKHGRARLTREAAAAIAWAFERGERKIDLARRYGVSPRAITYIVKGEHWRALSPAISNPA